MKLNLIQKSKLEYVLINAFRKEQGIITAIDSGKDYLQIVRYCVAFKYRSSEERRSKGKYGRKLLDSIIAEAKKNPKITKILVVPKSEEIYDDIEPMDIEQLYRRYECWDLNF